MRGEREPEIDDRRKKERDRAILGDFYRQSCDMHGTRINRKTLPKRESKIATQTTNIWEKLLEVLQLISTVCTPIHCQGPHD